VSSRLHPERVSRSRTPKPTPRSTSTSSPAAIIDRGDHGGDPFPPSATWRALVAAADDVCAEWSHTEHGAASPEDVRGTVTALLESVRQALNGDSLVLAGFPPFVPVRRSLELLRRAFLEHADGLGARDDLDASVLDIIKAMERVQHAIDQDAAHRFASRLSGQDAQQLVVEMAHDMRSPLGSILILAERLRYGSGGTLSPIQERQLGLVYSAAFGLSALAGDVIELARGGTTLMEQPAMPFLVSDVLQSILDILRPMAEEKRLAVRCVGPEADLRVGYQAALNRVLLNLATNAIKFTNAGSVDVTCRQLDRSRVEFSVKDTGRGIPPHVMSNLFEAFRQRQITGDYAFSSAGLGLSICKKLITAMGGELGVETELEKGTRFHFVLDLPQGSRL
jgi:signal transduction histidine kinase